MDSESDEGVVEPEVEEELEEESEASASGGGEPQEVQCDNKTRQISGRKNRKRNMVDFDRNLPSTHSYLGSDMEEVQSGRTIHEDHCFIDIPICNLPGIVLIPDQIIPLHLFQPQMVAMMKCVAEKDKTFGVMTYRHPSNKNEDLDVYGTTAEIFSTKDETDDISGISTLRIKARGRQRFRLIESHRDITGVLRGKVQIMAERILPEFLDGARPASHSKFRLKPLAWVTNKKTNPKLCKVINLDSKRKPTNSISCAAYTWWPPWVYNMFDTDFLFQEVKIELQSWNDSLNKDTIPKTATELSFWLAQNLPLDDTIKLRLISYDSAVQRLRYELQVMKLCTVLQCKFCNASIANKNDVFSMAMEGPMGAYVNPAGHVHETLTICRVNKNNLKLIGQPSTEQSWFPGYAWTIAQCNNCANHMGWRFKAEKNKKLSPPKFWGLCRSSLIPGMQSDDDEKLQYMR